MMTFDDPDARWSLNEAPTAMLMHQRLDGALPRARVRFEY